MSSFRQLQTLTAAFAAVALLACGQPSIEAPVREAEIGPEGGTLNSSGARLEVPPGALDTRVLIEMIVESRDVPGHEPQSAVVRFEPAGLVLKIPATLELDHSGDDDVVLWLGTGRDDVPFIPVDRSGAAAEASSRGRSSGSVDHLEQAFAGPRNPCRADLDNDPTNCGVCGNVCPSDGGEASCVSGQCAIECDEGRESCSPSATPPTDENGTLTCADEDLERSSCKGNKVAVCHVPPGNPDNAHTICISRNALRAHLAHNDGCGPCGDIDGCEVSTIGDPDNCGACGVSCDEQAVCGGDGSEQICACLPGYDGDGFSCNDIDECDRGTDNCAVGATCTNTPGSFTCACPEGFAVVDEVCVDIDECDDEEASRCDANAVCENTPGGFTCSCASGYEGDGFTCDEIDECALGLDACDELATCTNTDGSYTCECLPGYDGDGFRCGDVDECEVPERCHEQAVCANAPGDFTCTCKTGWVGDGYDCVDRNECADGTHRCDESAVCTNTEGGYTCACPGGTVGDGYSCADIDECANGTAECPENTECVNTRGGYECDPHATCVSDDDTSCTCVADECLIDECAEGLDRCHRLATCTDTPEGYTCECPEGMRGDGVSCEFIDECAEGTADCGPDGVCVDLKVGYTCECPEGTMGDGRSCADIDECADGSHSCSRNADCTNTDGGYLCDCHPGFVGNGFQCQDVDECSDGTATCGLNAACVNTPGTWYCECLEGFRGDGFVCEDIDECAEGTHSCTNPEMCRNVPGSYFCECPDGTEAKNGKCDCPDGFEWDGFACVDIDECVVTPTLCGVGECVNGIGTCSCVCPGGYRADGLRCVAVNPCAEELDNCADEAKCIFDANRPGAFTCECPKGYSGDGTVCEEIDECALELDNCDPNAVCENTDGSFTCTCREGWIGNGRACIEETDPEAPDETCANTELVCDPNARCSNTVEGPTCVCDDGYEGDGVTCFDIDECALGLDDCGPNGFCINTDGGFTCECAPGFEWDGAGCADIDECNDGSHDCGDSELCVNEIGSYTCECAPGYAGPSCLDVDECAFAMDDCADDEICTNTDGGYTCTCANGYEMVEGACADIDECERGTDACADEATCTNTAGSYACTCNPGFSGDGFQCVNIDECALELDDCGDNTVCEDTFGSYTCRCADGYIGDDCRPAPQCAEDVVASGDHTCALLDSGEVRCWGANYHGELGYGHEAPIGDDEAAFEAGAVGLGGAAVEVAAGVTHNCARLANGDVVCWGRNRYGQLGYGHVRDIGDDELPADAGPVDIGGTVAQLAAGGEHSCALLDNGDVRCWGLNIHGQLGLGHKRAIGDDEVPASVAAIDLGGSATKVAASRDHTCALLDDGAVRCWGRNDWGQLGYGHISDIGDNETPADAGDVPVGGPAKDIATGWYHSCALLETGAVRCWGYGDLGQLGYGDTEWVGDNETAGARGDIDLGDEAVALEAGAFHTCARMADGALRCWGAGEGGRLGHAIVCNIGDDETPASFGDIDLGGTASEVATGFAHTCALVDGCSVRCWGNEDEGQLGYGGGEPTRTPSRRGDVPVVADLDECAAGTDTCGDNSTCVNRIGGFDCVCDPGYSGDGITSGPADEDGVCYQINECLIIGDACGDNAACVDTDGSYECVCEAGYLGDGLNCSDLDECRTGVAACDANADCTNTEGSYTCSCEAGYAGDGFTCRNIDECTMGTHGCHPDAVCQDLPGSYTCGCPEGYTGDGLSCEDIDECETGTDQCVANAACSNLPGSYDCTCRDGYTGDGWVHCEALPTALYAGGNTTCARIGDRDLNCWGDNTFGQLGRGHTDAIGDDETPAESGLVALNFDVGSVSVGREHTCAIGTDGGIRCWGNGAAGRLGNSSTRRIGDDENLMSLPAMSLGGTAAALSAGYAHSCAVLDTGTARCWGANYQGSLGYGFQQDVGDNETPADVGDITIGGTLVSVVTGRVHTCVLLDDGSVKCWGSNSYGQLGYAIEGNIGDDEVPLGFGPVQLAGPAVQLAGGHDHTCALLESGAVQCWGLGLDGRLGYASTESIGDDEVPLAAGTVNLGGSAVTIAAGASHTCALLDSGTVRCWGDGSFYQLGLGSPDDVGDDELPSEVAAVALPPVVGIAAGRAHTCALTADREVYCWGAGSQGQLGHGRVSSEPTPVQIGVTAR